MQIRLSKTGGQINADITHGYKATALFVASFGPGPIAAWNASNKEKQVKAKDWILSVNGQQGLASEKLLPALKEFETLELVISRPAQPFQY